MVYMEAHEVIWGLIYVLVKVCIVWTIISSEAKKSTSVALGPCNLRFCKVAWTSRVICPYFLFFLALIPGVDLCSWDREFKLRSWLLVVWSFHLVFIYLWNFGLYRWKYLVQLSWIVVIWVGVGGHTINSGLELDFCQEYLISSYFSFPHNASIYYKYPSVRYLKKLLSWEEWIHLINILKPQLFLRTIMFLCIRVGLEYCRMTIKDSLG